MTRYVTEAWLPMATRREGIRRLTFAGDSTRMFGRLTPSYSSAVGQFDALLELLSNRPAECYLSFCEPPDKRRKERESFEPSGDGPHSHDQKRPPRAWRRRDFEKRALTVGIGGTWGNFPSLIFIEVVSNREEDRI